MILRYLRTHKIKIILYCLILFVIWLFVIREYILKIR